MYKNEYILSVDIKKTMASIVPTFVQFDSATLIFKMFDNGKPIDLTNLTKAEVGHKRPDGVVVIGQGVAETLNGEKVIRYSYTGDEMLLTGIVKTSLSIFSDTKKISIHPFEVRIVDDLNNA